MAEELIISAGSKEEKYRELLPQIEAVVEDETDLIANMANIASMLHETFGFWWTGFYRVHPPLGEQEGNFLILGPFQGPLACTRIKKGEGVCGTAWERGETVLLFQDPCFPFPVPASAVVKSSCPCGVMVA